MIERTYLFWPIRFSWSNETFKMPWFTWHAWQAGWVDVGHGAYGWTFHLGRFKILFGPMQPLPAPKKYVRGVCHSCQNVAPLSSKDQYAFQYCQNCLRAEFMGEPAERGEAASAEPSPPSSLPQVVESDPKEAG
jgi:hypothetical protein